MRMNRTYKAMIDKSISSMISAIELYNKPDFHYREETFAILAVNSWELLLKAQILKQNNYKINSIYCLQRKTNKDGSPSKRKTVDRNRANNPKAISIVEAMNKLSSRSQLPNPIRANIEALIELRDNAIHFINESSLTKQIQELGFACVKNYIDLLKEWNVNVRLDRYNLYLMPLAYIDGNKLVEAKFTQAETNFIGFIQQQLKKTDNSGYQVVMPIGVSFKKENSFDAIKVVRSKDGIPITLSPENIKKIYPWNYKTVVEECKKRYSNFKQGKTFNSAMKEVKQSSQLCYKRFLDPDNPKSSKKEFYSTSIWSILDKYFQKVKR